LDFAKCKAQMPGEKKRLLQQLAIFWQIWTIL
jgi:hypothetical protein